MMALVAGMQVSTVSMAMRKEAEVEEVPLGSLSRFHKRSEPLELLPID